MLLGVELWRHVHTFPGDPCVLWAVPGNSHVGTCQLPPVTRGQAQHSLLALGSCLSDTSPKIHEPSLLASELSSAADGGWTIDNSRQQGGTAGLHPDFALSHTKTYGMSANNDAGWLLDPGLPPRVSLQSSECLVLKHGFFH